MGWMSATTGSLCGSPVGRGLVGGVCSDVGDGRLVVERPVGRLRVGERRARGDGGRGAVAGGGDVDAAKAVVAELHDAVGGDHSLGAVVAGAA